MNNVSQLPNIVCASMQKKGTDKYCTRVVFDRIHGGIRNVTQIKGGSCKFICQ